MSSYYQKINTLYKRDMTKPKKPIILGEYSEPEFEVLKDLKWYIMILIAIIIYLLYKQIEKY